MPAYINFEGLLIAIVNVGFWPVADDQSNCRIAA
jgi:hypothetical protein